MKNPYWYFIPRSPIIQPPYEKPMQPPVQRPVQQPREYPPCFIEERYCDYFDLGDKAPEFTLEGIIDHQPKDVSLSDYLGKWVVLFFYGSNFTFV